MGGMRYLVFPYAVFELNESLLCCKTYVKMDNRNIYLHVLEEGIVKSIISAFLF